MRSMVTVEEILAIRPIEDADRIVVADVLGWHVVIPVDAGHKVGDKVLYFETDTMLPNTDPRFESFQKNGVKTIEYNGQEVTGHVLRSLTMRGARSQGLIMPVEDFYEDIYYWAVVNSEASSTDPSWEPHVGMDVTEAIGVFKYEAPIPPGANYIGDFDTRFTAKSEAVRIQKMPNRWDEIKSLKWDATVKVDGSSTTLVNDEGVLRIFSHAKELDVNKCGQFDLAVKTGIADVVKDNPGMAVQFEYAGPGESQNRLKLSTMTPFVFSVSKNGDKIGRDEWDARLLPVAAPLLGDEWDLSNFGTMDDLVNAVAELRGNVAPGRLDEGIVFHLAAGEKIPLWIDRTLNFKVISIKYCLKHGL